MKKWAVLNLILLNFFISCELKKNSNPLRGVIYRDIKTLQVFKDFEDLGGMVIDTVDDSGNYHYAIERLRSNKNDVLIFERIINHKDSTKPDYEILDTISIDKLNDSLQIMYGLCRQDTIANSEIIAIVYGDNNMDFYNRVVKAWRADIKQEKIILIENLKGIDCINEGDGGCPDESSGKE